MKHSQRNRKPSWNDFKHRVGEPALQPNPLQTQTEIVWGKEYWVLGHISELKMFGDHVSIRLRERPGMIWVGWPRMDHHVSTKDVNASKMRAGTLVHVEFREHGLNAVGVHMITRMRKASLIERLSFLFFGEPF